MPKPGSLTEIEVQRNNLLDAACHVIGNKGYKGASISRIAEAAGISIGHCYKFFKTREDLLDAVILRVEESFEAFVEARKVDVPLGYRRLQVSILEHYLRFQETYPYYFTILRDSEVETPDTWRRVTERRLSYYRDAAFAAWDRGEIKGYRRDQITDLSRFLWAVRKAIVFNDPDPRPDLSEAIATYDRFVGQAIGDPSEPLS